MSAFHLLSVEFSTRGGFDSLLVYIFLFSEHPLLDRTFTLPPHACFCGSEICHCKSPMAFKNFGVPFSSVSVASAPRPRIPGLAYAARQRTRVHCGETSSGSSFTGYMHSLRSSDCLHVIEEEHPITSGPTFYPSR